MSELRNKMIFDLELKGYSAGTVKLYLANVRNFAKYFNKSPELLGENEIRHYLHYCITERHFSEVYVNTIHASLKFIYTKTLGREWSRTNLSRVKQYRKLPNVLSKGEVKAIFDVTKNLKHKAMLMTIYGAGLRVSEVANLAITDIDSKNMQIKVRKGKGKKDRYTFLSEANLIILRQYFRKYQPTILLFPGQNPNKPLSLRTIQLVVRDSAKKAGITKQVTPHTLRHCFSTHSLENGTDIYYIQKLLGHSNISTTTIYLHMRRLDLINIKSPLDTL